MMYSYDVFLLLYIYTAGSGKTYTMTSIYERLAAALFPADGTCHDSEVRVSFFEISGDMCVDLFNHSNTVTLLKCHRSGATVGAARGGGGGTDTEYFQAFPAVEPRVRTGEDLLALIRCGTAARNTAATGMVASLCVHGLHGTCTQCGLSNTMV